MSHRAYTAVLRISLRDNLAYLKSFFISNVFFVVVLYIFHTLWKVVFGENSMMEGFSLKQTLWYLTFAEAMTFAHGGVWREIQEEVKDGSLAYGLLRPYNYPLFKIVQAMGASLLRLTSLLIMGYGIALLLVGPLTGSLKVLAPNLILMMLGLMLIQISFVMIGLMAFWMEEVAPIFWVWQKFLFILGGTFLPLDFLPAWLQGITSKLPFAYSIYWPSRLMVHFSWQDWFRVLLGQIFWIGVLSAGAALLYSRARHKVQAQGG